MDAVTLRKKVKIHIQALLVNYKTLQCQLYTPSMAHEK